MYFNTRYQISRTMMMYQLCKTYNGLSAVFARENAWLCAHKQWGKDGVIIVGEDAMKLELRV